MGLLQDGQSQQTLHLTAGDGDGSRGGEAGNDRDGDEVNEEAESEEAAQEDDAAGEEGEEDGVLGAVLGVEAGHQGHDGSGPDGDVFRAAEDDVDETSHEGGVQAVLGRQAGHESVGDTCRVEGELGCDVKSVMCHNVTSPCGMTVRPTVTPAIQSDTASFRLYFGNQEIIGSLDVTVSGEQHSAHLEK